ncbi:MAG: TolC family protein [Nitrospinae bacterium]|nr:TolC family protein [Nitrospinota bacterium]MCH8313027.1 TolC family protein [Nitrospinota bacterium]
MKRKVLLILVILLSAVSGSGVWAEEAEFQRKLKAFISIALENNPALLEAQNKIKVSKEIPPQAGSLDDPILRFGLSNLPVDTFAFDEHVGTTKDITISQKLPFPGKLGLRTDMANKNVGIAEETYDDLKLRIIRDVKRSYFELCFVLAAIEITKQNKGLLEQFVTIAETKYSVGKGIQQDVIKAQVELSKNMDELIDLKKRKETEKGKLNTLMDLLPQSPLVIPHGITKSSFNYKIEELQSLAEEHRPVLEQIRLSKERYQIARKLAKKDYYPNFNVGFKYGQRENGRANGIGTFQNRPDFVSAFVGINIPIWYKTKQSRKVAEQSYRVKVAQEAYNKVRNQIFLGIKKLMDQEAKSSETLTLIKTAILPQARQSLESALAGYGVDKVDFLSLLDTQVTLLNWEIKYHRELADYEKTLAKLEQTVGKSLF